MDLEGRLLDHRLFVFPILPSCPFHVVLLDPLVLRIFPFVIEVAQESQESQESLEVTRGSQESLEVTRGSQELLEAQELLEPLELLEAQVTRGSQVLEESLEEKKKAPEEPTSHELIQVRPTDEKVHTYSSHPLIIHPSPRLIIVTSHRAMDIPTK